ncbi:hypothetical protein IG193_08590 [Infirmifilum lucidum]|uniref:Uncharacterized protein n=1 Tax=Infirmifilum lucidum TaxID=2776706 RepID=A0A7L9FG63_9CREN|nr:hypothetical protein [Infirmifilum lucidum]QOJ78790.1 hypothetical protein IG193_08590 [Infirmifilum lucidum]
MPRSWDLWFGIFVVSTLLALTISFLGLASDDPTLSKIFSYIGYALLIIIAIAAGVLLVLGMTSEDEGRRPSELQSSEDETRRHY